MTDLVNDCWPRFNFLLCCLAEMVLNILYIHYECYAGGGGGQELDIA